ncbi:reverse transcriptase/maturase family protein, partial [Halobacillus karajensis]|uniref:reverse transcriptase/maturase family protein n=1 Tax=Halobacillus karajensis TaxID=195088 RepID=UPI0009438272
NDGALTLGVDQRSIDGFSMDQIDKLIKVLRNKTYQPYPSKRIYIPKKNGKKRPLGIPSFCDKLVQEVIRLILEAIFKPSFSSSSHAYQEKKSCHSALLEIKRTFTGSKWFVEGDIKGFFDNIEHHTLIKILRKRIADEAFLDLIWKFLRAGYVEEWKFHQTYSGAPQGGIISPILSNIYLNELDTYIKEYRDQFNHGKKRRRNPKYRQLSSERTGIQKEINQAYEQGNNQAVDKLKKQLTQVEEALLRTSYSNPMDSEYRRLSYVRYADDFLIGIIGSKKDAKQVRDDIATYLAEKLNLELSMEKTLITHASNKSAYFLGYEIEIVKNHSFRRNRLGRKQRLLNGKVKLKMPHNAWVNKLQKYKAIKMCADGTWKPKFRGYFQHSEDIEIVAQYNSEIRGLYNYFRLAENVSNHMHRFAYFMYYSMLKTFASKYRTNTKHIRRKYEKNKRFTVEYQTSKGTQHMHFINRSFPRIAGLSKEQVDL